MPFCTNRTATQRSPAQSHGSRGPQYCKRTIPPARPSVLPRSVGEGGGGRGTRPGWSDVTGVATSQCRSLAPLSPSIPLITHTVSLFLSSHSQPFPFLHSPGHLASSLSLSIPEPAVSGRFLGYADDSFTRLAVCSSFPYSSSFFNYSRWCRWSRF